MRSERGFLRRAVGRLTASDSQVEADELKERCMKAGATLAAQLPDRCRVKVSGTLRTVTLRPHGAVQALDAELYDGSGSVSLVWLGRRQIPGIEPGRVLSATGLVTRADGRAVMYNPAYELRLPAAG